MRFLVQTAALAAVFAAVTGLAELLGAANLGTSMAFGQLGFSLALGYVLLRI